MIITNNGQVIRTKISGISLLGRNTQGVRLINLKGGEKVVAVENIAESDSFRHAQTYKNLSQYDDAIDAFMEIKKDIQHQYYVDSFHEIGLCYFYKKDWKKAIKYWKDFLVRSKEREKIISTKFLMANAYETNEELKKAYNIYYSILNDYPNPSVIKNRLESLYARRVARKR
jgi:tetratricopeptide (TPR) repeat protein